MGKEAVGKSLILIGSHPSHSDSSFFDWAQLDESSFLKREVFVMTDDLHLQLEDDLETEIENFLLENEDLIEDDEEVKLINRE